MSEASPTKKALKTQFLIKKADDASPAPVTPVRIAPPPVTVKRSKSLKSDRTLFKRQANVPSTTPEKRSVTLPRQHTAPALSITAQKPEQELKTEKTDVTSISNGDAPTNGISYKKNDADLPSQANWQTVVNTHRRGTSMTFVSTQNWAQFDKEQESETKSNPETEPETTQEPFEWSIPTDKWSTYERMFHEIKPLHGFISGKQAKEFLSKTDISVEYLTNIWELADMDHDGSLSLVEFAVAVHCVAGVERGEVLPTTVPATLTDSLIYHVNNRNTLLASLKVDENAGKSPEKSALKTCCSTSKGTNVTFKEDTSETLPRSRPRPSKKLFSTTPLHLREQCCHSSSSYYSSDSSTEEECISIELDMSDDGVSATKTKKKKKADGDKKKTRKSKSSSSSRKATSPPHQETPGTADSSTPVNHQPVRRERTYDDVDDFLTKINLNENDEDIEALIQSSDEEADKAALTRTTSIIPSMPPPSMDPPKRTPSRPDGLGAPRRPPPSGPPPSGAPPTSPPPSSPPGCALPEEDETDQTTSDGAGNTSSSYKETSDHRDTEGYELLAENAKQPVTILLDGGELIDSEEEEDEEKFDTVEEGEMCDELNTAPGYGSLTGAVCALSDLKVQKDHLLAEAEELNTEITHDHPPDWDLSDAEQSECDLDQLAQTELNDLRTLIRDYELHNNALLNVTRELKIELLKVKEHKLHLQSTLKCMKKV